MLKIIAIIAALIAVAAAAVLAVAATKPDDFRVQRSVSIKAPPEKIFPLINAFDNWPLWSPYEKRDPDMKRARSGPPSGQGAVYEWDGNRNVGQGRMEILEATPERIRIKLDFIRPFEGHNMAVFMLTPKGETTDVSWAMEGPMHYCAKIISVFFSMDRMIGDDFTAGLNNLKAVAEK
ncbi:MAG: SRPBCC family protein [Pseudorhodoplanes sp.]